MDTFKLKERLKSGETVFGPLVRTTEPVITEIIGYSGFDFVVIDLEHGPANIHQAENLVRAAKSSNITSIVRVREASETLILRALDTGAGGVQIPQINNSLTAEEMIKASKFYPEGNRGVCKFTRNSEYSNIDKSVYFEKANNNTITVVQVEGLEGVQNIDSILEVPGIDVLFLGPYDLSQALGITGQVENVKVLNILEEITKKARDRNIAVGCFANDVDSIKRQKAMGIQYLCTYIDTGFIYESFQSRVLEINSIIGK